jgi:hypothetical protein
LSEVKSLQQKQNTAFLIAEYTNHGRFTSSPFFSLRFVFDTVNLWLNASLEYSYIGSGLAGPCFTIETRSESVSFGGHDPGSDIVILFTLASEWSSLGTLPPSSDEDNVVLCAMLKLGRLAPLPSKHPSLLDPPSSL